MKKLTFLLFFIPFIGSAQDKGTHFETTLSFQQLKEKAKKENKLVLVDCSATWCGWCKKMRADIFPQEKVARFINEHFVSVEVQMDETPKDDAYVKSWRNDAAVFKPYAPGYPTYLIYSPDGDIVDRIVGYHDADAFLAATQKSLVPQSQYFTLLRKYNAGENDAALLYTLAMISPETAAEEETAEKAAQGYLSTQSNLYTRKNLDLVLATARNSKSPSFELLLNHAAEADAILGKGQAEEKTSAIIINEEIFSKMNGKGHNNVDSLAAQARAKYPLADLTQGIAMVRIQEAQSDKNWKVYQPAVIAYMEQYGGSIDPEILNNFAWTFFENCHDTAGISKALEWSKRSVAATAAKKPEFLDTYANLLYKSGQSATAIVIEEKAMALVGAEDRRLYAETLEKMKKGIHILPATMQ